MVSRVSFIRPDCYQGQRKGVLTNLLRGNDTFARVALIGPNKTYLGGHVSVVRVRHVCMYMLLFGTNHMYTVDMGSDPVRIGTLRAVGAHLPPKFGVYRPISVRERPQTYEELLLWGQTIVHSSAAVAD